MVLKSTMRTSSPATARRSTRPCTRAPGPIPANRRRWRLRRGSPARRRRRTPDRRERPVFPRTIGLGFRVVQSARAQRIFSTVSSRRPRSISAGAPTWRGPEALGGNALRFRPSGEGNAGSSMPAATEGRINQGDGRSAGGGVRAQSGIAAVSAALAASLAAGATPALP